MSYAYYNQTRTFRETDDEGHQIKIRGTSGICTDVADAYIRTIECDDRMMITDLFVTGHCCVKGYPADGIVLSMNDTLTGVKAIFGNEDVSEYMIYLFQNPTMPFGRSVITRELKHVYKQESISNYFENRIIMELGHNQKVLLGVSQSLNRTQGNGLKGAGSAETQLAGARAVAKDAQGEFPKMGKWQEQKVGDLVEATKFKKEDLMPSVEKLKDYRDQAIKLLRGKGVECSPKPIYTEEIFKIAEGLMMLKDVDDAIKKDLI